MGSALHRSKKLTGNTTMSNRFNIRVFIVIVILLLLGIVGFNFLSRSTVNVVVETGNIVGETQVILNDNKLYPTGQDGATYRGKTGIGNHDIQVVSPGYEAYSTQISTSILSNETVVVTLKPISPELIAKELYGFSDLINVSGARFFGNNSWLVFSVSDKGVDAEGSIVVAKFDDGLRTWSIVDEGTDIDTSQDKYIDAPTDLISFLRGY